MPPLVIYKKFRKKLSGLQWFALEATESNDDVNEYVFQKQPKLLDIGRGDIREMIINKILFKDPHSPILSYSDPDYQYSGDDANRKYHNLLKTYFSNHFDGTIIDSNHLEQSRLYSIADLDGASEIVIWKNHSKLLKEINIK